MHHRVVAFSVLLLVSGVPRAEAALEPVFDACRIGPNPAVIDFEGQTVGAVASPFTIDAVTFSADALGVVSLVPFGANGTEVEGNAIVTLDSATITSGPYLPMTLEFSPPVAQAGFGLWDPNFQGNTLTAFDDQGAELASVAITDLFAPGGGGATFIGFVSDEANIASLVFTPVSTGEFYAIDNLLYTTELPPPDADGDCVLDVDDNCRDLANADQRDSNADGYGNVCDADLNDDCIVNALDLGLLKLQFFGAGPDADFDGDGVVNVVDLGIMRSLFFDPPGPSAFGDCTLRHSSADK